jgi:hypothetical protein
VVRIRRPADALIRLVAGLACVASLLAVSGQVRATSLQRLTVTSFTLSADTLSPQIEVPFRLMVSLHVREAVPEIDNLNLPILAELELQGDERQTRAGPGGTDYIETIEVIAHHTGDISIAPATLQAIDARDGKPKQYSTNPLTLHVVGGALEPLQQGGSFAAAALALALRVLEWLVAITVVIIAVVWLFRRRRRTPPPPPPAPAAPMPVAVPVARPVRSLREQLQDALTVLRAERTRAAAVRVRSAVWGMVGASDGETLADVLQRPQANDPRMRDLLRALERAAFTYDDDLTAAIGDACDALERYLA